MPNSMPTNKSFEDSGVRSVIAPLDDSSDRPRERPSASASPDWRRSAFVAFSVFSAMRADAEGRGLARAGPRGFGKIEF